MKDVKIKEMEFVFNLFSEFFIFNKKYKECMEEIQKHCLGDEELLNKYYIKFNQIAVQMGRIHP